jgi:hypothetical protein
MAETRYIERSAGDEEGYSTSRFRSRSLNVYDDSQSREIHARMKTTREGMIGPIKGNVRGLAIQDPFPTFEQLLTDVPLHVAFDIELSKSFSQISFASPLTCKQNIQCYGRQKIGTWHRFQWKRILSLIECLKRSTSLQEVEVLDFRLLVQNYV